MSEFTAREMAWLRSIAAPPIIRLGEGSAVRETRSCLNAAHSKLTGARRLLAETTPAGADWKRYL